MLCVDLATDECLVLYPVRKAAKREERILRYIPHFKVHHVSQEGDARCSASHENKIFEYLSN